MWHSSYAIGLVELTTNRFSYTLGKWLTSTQQTWSSKENNKKKQENNKKKQENNSKTYIKLIEQDVFWWFYHGMNHLNEGATLK